MNEYPNDIDPKMMEYPMDEFIRDVEESLRQESLTK